MINVAFCEDDEYFLEKIKGESRMIFKKLRVSANIYTYTNGFQLIESFKNYDPYFEIIFLDINMPKLNGKETAERLRLLDKKFKLIFITAYEKEAINTFKYDVIAFLPKTSLDESLFETINLAITKLKEDNHNIHIFKVVGHNNNIITVKIPIDDIVYFESINRKVYLCTNRDTFELRGYQFSEVVDKYTQYGFADIHRSCIVNMKYIHSVSNFEVILDNGVSLPLSRRKRKQLLENFI